jgi:hypothetical protein
VKRTLIASLLLGGCGGPDATDAQANAGVALEQAAVRVGLVPDAARAPLVGAWARGSDRVCVVPGAEGGGAERIGVLLDYGDGNGCVGSGTVRRTGQTLSVELGRCRVDARFDGERIAFPPELPSECERLCRGNATLSALTVERVSASASEAATLRAPSGRPLCAG